MSKKDYIKFAAMFKEILEKYDDDLVRPAPLDYIFQASKIFHYDNPAFRPYQFFEACGIDKNTARFLHAKI
jgi:hypothetical protein